MENEENKNKVSYECLKKHTNLFVASPDTNNDHGCIECLKSFLKDPMVNKYLYSNIGTYCFNADDCSIDDEGHIIPKLPIFLTYSKTESRALFPDFKRKFLDIVKYQLMQEMSEQDIFYRQNFPRKYENNVERCNQIQSKMFLQRRVETIEKEIQEYRREYQKFPDGFYKWMERSLVRKDK